MKETPKEGEVVITYVDTKGNEIQKPRQDTPKSPYDTPYDTTEKVKNQISSRQLMVRHIKLFLKVIIQ